MTVIGLSILVGITIIFWVVPEKLLVKFAEVIGF